MGLFTRKKNNFKRMKEFAEVVTDYTTKFNQLQEGYNSTMDFLDSQKHIQGAESIIEETKINYASMAEILYDEVEKQIEKYKKELSKLNARKDTMVSAESREEATALSGAITELMNISEKIAKLKAKILGESENNSNKNKEEDQPAGPQ